MKKLILFAAAGVCFLTGPGPLAGGQPLTLQVSPPMSVAPAFVSVRALVEASDDNRALEIIAQSTDFFRSSYIDLKGRNAPPLSVFNYPNLPPGLYDVTAILVGTGGKRATATRLVRVIPSAGSGQ